MLIEISRRFWRDCEKEGTTRLHEITQRGENERYCDSSIVCNQLACLKKDIVAEFCGNYKEKHKVAVETLLKRLELIKDLLPLSPLQPLQDSFSLSLVLHRLLQYL
uniref:Uncharacterized protein n=1 Tax=Candidatus Methanophaga sp. ANME-1 ERB7 TaxID=2759913 RepID=A0A7G9Z684_9EURY|nr:hypothetical protein HKFFHJMH_00018 [Methanosarcinales archaeon ANME-1 ERB7]